MPQTKSSRYAARKKNPAATSLGMRTGKTRETYILPWQKHKFGMLALGAVAVLVFVGLVAGGTRAQTTLPAAGQRGGLGYGDLATIVANMQTTINNLTTQVNALTVQVTNIVNSGGGGTPTPPPPPPPSIRIDQGPLSYHPVAGIYTGGAGRSCPTGYAPRVLNNGADGNGRLGCTQTVGDGYDLGACSPPNWHPYWGWHCGYAPIRGCNVCDPI